MMPAKPNPREPSEPFEPGDPITSADGRQGTVNAVKGEYLYIRLRASQRVVKVNGADVSRGWKDP